MYVKCRLYYPNTKVATVQYKYGRLYCICTTNLFSMFYLFQSLKTLKHPGILKFLAFIKNADEKWVITERVVPLETVIDKLSPTEICAGLYSVVEALAFLNDRVSYHESLLFRYLNKSLYKS